MPCAPPHRPYRPRRIHADRRAGICRAAALVQAVAKYRRAVELLLDAPYGTVEIIRAEELAEFGIRN